jgi:hypothetical protein
MRNASLHLAGILAMAFFAGTARAAFIGPLDFESSGQIQYSDNFNTGITVAVLDQTTSPVDPFRPSGNHSLMVEDASGASNGSSTAKADWWNATPDTGLTHGTFTGRFYTSEIGGTGSAYMSLRLGTNTLSTLDTVAFAFTVNGTSISFGGATLDNTWVVGDPHNLVLNFAFGTDKITVSGTLDRNALKSGTTTQFLVLSPSVSSINAFEILAGSSSNSNSRVIADDVTLAVPEPATMALLGLGTLGVLMRRRR